MKTEYCSHFTSEGIEVIFPAKWLKTTKQKQNRIDYWLKIKDNLEVK